MKHLRTVTSMRASTTTISLRAEANWLLVEEFTRVLLLTDLRKASVRCSLRMAAAMKERGKLADFMVKACIYGKLEGDMKVCRIQQYLHSVHSTSIEGPFLASIETSSLSSPIGEWEKGERCGQGTFLLDNGEKHEGTYQVQRTAQYN